MVRKTAKETERIWLETFCLDTLKQEQTNYICLTTDRDNQLAMGACQECPLRIKTVKKNTLWLTRINCFSNCGMIQRQVFFLILFHQFAITLISNQMYTFFLNKANCARFGLGLAHGPLKGDAHGP